MRPIIGVTFKADVRDNPLNNYTQAIEQCGGVPVVLFPDEPRAELEEIDGLLLTGGGDIHPDSFKEEWHPTLSHVNEARDALEMRLCQQALIDDLPVFGICRGIQVMNVAMSGSLYQDIPSQFSCPLPHKVKHGDSQHDIKIQPHSLLHRITNERNAKVNSAHHQAIKVIGNGFVVTAQSTDGVIEAIEDMSRRFMLGVQYHPERMLLTPELCEHGQKLFQAFIDAATR